MKTSYPDIITLPWNALAAESWFTALSDYPWAMILHSGYTDHPYGRFDILVADPIGTLVTYGSVTQVSLSTIFTSQENPFLLLKEALNICRLHAEIHPDIPFQGGALGLFGYDLAHHLEKLPKYALNDIDIPDMVIGLYDWALIVDHHKKKVFLLSHSNVNARLDWLKAQRKVLRPDFHLTTAWKTNVDLEEYAVKFNQIKSYLQSGDCYQVNLAQRFQAEYEGDEWKTFTQLNMLNKAPFSAFLRLEKGAILSFSPERFIYLSNGNIQTRPIKGTLPRLTCPKEDRKQSQRLARSPKDRAENLMIVDLMRNDIGRVAEPGTVLVPELFVVESFPSVYHLVSTITAHLPPPFGACDLLCATFPGGSVTGAPKIRAMEIIEELEPHRRNAWCGSIGYISVCGNMDTNITIRTLTAFNGRIYCSAGGGITIDSHLREEYQETLNKVNSILQNLQNLNQ